MLLQSLWGKKQGHYSLFRESVCLSSLTLLDVFSYNFQDGFTIINKCLHVIRKLIKPPTRGCALRDFEAQFKKTKRGEGIQQNKNYQLQMAFFTDGAFELLEFNHKPIIWKCKTHWCSGAWHFAACLLSAKWGLTCLSEARRESKVIARSLPGSFPSLCMPAQSLSVCPSVSVSLSLYLLLSLSLPLSVTLSL